MKVFVIGSHGNVGQRLIPKLVNSGHQVIAGMRKKDEFNSLPDSNQVKPALFDLTESPADMRKAFKDSGAESIIFTAGAGGGVTAQQTILTDLDGAAKSMDAAKAMGIKRYVMISSMNAGEEGRATWPQSGLHIYLVAKHYSDNYLRQSGLNYTILHPSGLSNDKGNNKIKVNTNDISNAKPISRDDVASSIVQVLGDIQTIQTDYNISGGNDNIQNIL